MGWYNGLPEFAGLDPDLGRGDHALVIGNGNVALDVARILLSGVDKLRETDISSRALEGLSKSNVTKVTVAGRRGPMQVCIPFAKNEYPPFKPNYCPVNGQFVYVMN